MKLRYVIPLLLIILLIGLINSSATKKNNNMKITSEAFLNGGTIPREFTCDGAGTNPPLNFSDIPKEARSLALIYEDPDAPRSSYAPDGIWIHWIVWSISPSKNSISGGETGFGITGTNSSGRRSYDMPCPPNGEHRYIFKLYALDSLLDLASTSVKSNLLESMQNHVLAKAELLGRYSR